MKISRNVQLGLGLLSIGRQWGVRDVVPPTAGEALELLDNAVAQGIRFFDTAPAYGTSEARLGRFLKTTDTPRKELLIATKMGEFWNAARRDTWVSHAYDDLIESIDRSLDLLGQIDVLQVHKANAANLRAADVMRALDYAQARGVGGFGASVSDCDAAMAACASERYGYLQFPYNCDHTKLGDIFNLAAEHGMTLLINRPLAMGRLAPETEGASGVQRAFEFVLQQQFDGVILTGTSSSKHLADNVKAFEVARHCRQL